VVVLPDPAGPERRSIPESDFANRSSPRHDAYWQSQFTETVLFHEFRRHPNGGAKPMRRRHDRKSQIEGRRSRKRNRRAAFLRHIEPVGEQVRHHHQARHQSSSDARVYVPNVFEEPIDAEFDVHPVRRRFEMHIGCLPADRIVQDLVDQRAGVGRWNVHRCRFNHGLQQSQPWLRDSSK